MINSPPAASPTRRRILIDSGVQGTLVRRTGFYAAATAIYLLVIFVLSDSLSHPQEPLSESLFRCLNEAVFWAPGLMLLAPLFAYDLINISNRFVGPMFRLRRELRKLSNGEDVAPMYSRKNDFWGDAAESFNRLRDELATRRQADTESDEIEENGAKPAVEANSALQPSASD